MHPSATAEPRRTPLVLLHGFPLGPSLWDAVRPYLDGVFECHAPPLRGADGREPDAPFTVADLAGDVLAYLDSVGIERAVWCGHSMGGYVAFAAAGAAPERVAAVVAVDSRSSPDSPADRRAREASAREVATTGTLPFVERSSERLFGRSTPPDHAAREIARKAGGKMTPGAVSATLAALASRPDATPVVRALGVPLLVVHGDEDETVSTEEARDVAAAAPDGAFEAVEGAGHAVPMERPEALAAILVRYRNEWASAGVI